MEGKVDQHDREHPQRPRDDRARQRVALVTSAYHMPRALRLAARGRPRCRGLSDGFAGAAGDAAAVGELAALGRALGESIIALQGNRGP